MILDCDALWTRLVSAVYKVRRLPRVTNDPPPLPARVQERAATARHGSDR